VTSYHQKPLIIPVFLPNAGCPHQCVFCNQEAITGKKPIIPSSRELRSDISKFLEYKGEKRNKVQISFYGGNFLGLKKDHISFLLGEVSKFVKAGSVDSIRFSTRPDTVDKTRLDFLRDYPVSTIEIGVQSMNDRVLAESKRGHEAFDTKQAVALLRERNYEIGLQMMTGLPGDDEAGALESGRQIADLSPDFIRIYPTVVFKDSLLAKWYEKGKYTPMSLESSVTLAKQLYLLFNENRIKVIRMGIQVSEDLNEKSTILAGPYHPAFGHLVYSEIFLDKISSVLTTGSVLRDSISRICIKAHPRNVSRIRGFKNNNLRILKKEYGIKSIKIVSDISIEEGVIITGQ